MKQAKPEFVPGYLFHGPERPSEPGGIGPYTGEVFLYRGYRLRRRNQWCEIAQHWDSDTSVSVVGPGADWPTGYPVRPWRGRVANCTADGDSMQEALDEAWAAAEFEEQLHQLAPPGVTP